MICFMVFADVHLQDSLVLDTPRLRRQVRRYGNDGYEEIVELSDVIDLVSDSVMIMNFFMYSMCEELSCLTSRLLLSCIILYSSVHSLMLSFSLYVVWSLSICNISPSTPPPLPYPRWMRFRQQASTAGPSWSV